MCVCVCEFVSIWKKNQWIPNVHYIYVYNSVCESNILFFAQVYIPVYTNSNGEEMCKIHSQMQLHFRQLVHWK